MAVEQQAAPAARAREAGDQLRAALEAQAGRHLPAAGHVLGRRLPHVDVRAGGAQAPGEVLLQRGLLARLVAGMARRGVEADELRGQRDQLVALLGDGAADPVFVGAEPHGGDGDIGCPAMELTVACVQMAPVIGDLEGNAARAREAIERAAAAGAGLVVLPELVTSGYVFASAEEARALSLPAAEAAAPWIEAAAATGTVVAGGFAELGDDGRVYNSAALVDGGGLLASYRKVHLWDAERLVFAEGERFPPVVDTPVGRLGLAVCYDVEFPELVRGLALAGAELLCLPVNWPRFPEPDGERPMDIVRVMAAAVANRMFIAAADRCGAERGTDWVGGSVIAEPRGWLLAGASEPDEPQLVLARCDLALARDKRSTARNDALGDRRPAVYAQGPRLA